jgi:hypothetical protein
VWDPTVGYWSDYMSAHSIINATINADNSVYLDAGDTDYATAFNSSNINTTAMSGSTYPEINWELKLKKSDYTSMFNSDSF